MLSWIQVSLRGLWMESVKTVKNFSEAKVLPCITGFEQEELTGYDYARLRESMVVLRDVQKTVEERTEDMRRCCLEAKLVEQQKE